MSKFCSKKVFKLLIVSALLVVFGIFFSGCGTKANYMKADSGIDLLSQFNSVGEKNKLENINFKRDGGIDIIYTVKGSVDENREDIYKALNLYNSKALNSEHFKANYKVVDVISLVDVQRSYSNEGETEVLEKATRFILHCPNISNLNYYRFKEIDVDTYSKNENANLNGEKDYFNENGEKIDKLSVSSKKYRMIFFNCNKSGGAKVTFDTEIKGYAVLKDSQIGVITGDHEFTMSKTGQIIFILDNSAMSKPINVWILAISIVVVVGLGIFITNLILKKRKN